MNIEIIFIFIIYFTVLITVSFYFHIVSTQEEIKRDDLKNILPYIKNLSSTIKDKNSILIMISAFITFSALGLFIPIVITHYIVNSVLLYSIIFFLLPIIKERSEKSRVSSSEAMPDKFGNIFFKYLNLIIISFGFGNGTGLIVNWGIRDIGYFPFFAVNIIIVSGLIILAIKSISTVDIEKK